MFQTIERKVKTYAPLSVPKSLQKILPFKDTPKALLAKKESVQRVAVIREPHEAKVGKSHVPELSKWVLTWFISWLDECPNRNQLK